jgi:DNA-binding NtrC family response regulator
MAKKILVIEDDEAIRRMAARILARAGYEVIEAGDGKEGVRLFRSDLPNLVVTDIFMPEKEGLETIAELAGESPDVRIIAISGGGNLGILNPLPMAEKLRAARSLTKPFGRNDLLQAVVDLIGAP